MSDPNSVVMVETHSSADGYAWRSVFTVGLSMEQLRWRRDEFLMLDDTNRPAVVPNAEMPQNRKFAAFFGWLQGQEVQIQIGPRAIYGLDSPTAKQLEEMQAARAIIADLEFTHDPETELSVI